MYSSSIRSRSGSVDRERSEQRAPYRTSYGSKSSIAPSSSQIPPRRSRAASYDPFSSSSSAATRIPLSTSTMNSFNRPTSSSFSRPSQQPSMSSSYHDYTPTRTYNTPNRYGSTEQLSSYSSPSTYKSPYSTSTASASYRCAAPSFPPRRSGSTTNFSSSDSSYHREYTPSSSIRDYTSSRDYSSPSKSLSKYRPDSGLPSTSSYSRPSFTSSVAYSPRARYDYRSKTPGYTSSSETPSTSRTSRFDRDYKSMSRFENTPVRDKTPSDSEKDEKPNDEVEKTFQKLYNRYVKDIESDSESENAAPAPRKFISHSEAEEEASSEDEESPSECDSFAEKVKNMNINRNPLQKANSHSSITPRGSENNSPSKDLTPRCSPMLPRKNEPQRQEEVKTIPAEKKVLPAEVEKSAAEVFREKHNDIGMLDAVIPTRQLKPASSAMDKMLRRDSLTTKLSDAIEKKKSPTPSESIVDKKVLPSSTPTVKKPIESVSLTTTSSSSSTKPPLQSIIKKENSPTSSTTSTSSVPSKPTTGVNAKTIANIKAPVTKEKDPIKEVTNKVETPAAKKPTSTSTTTTTTTAANQSKTIPAVEGHSSSNTTKSTVTPSTSIKPIDIKKESIITKEKEKTPVSKSSSVVKKEASPQPSLSAKLATKEEKGEKKDMSEEKKDVNIIKKEETATDASKTKVKPTLVIDTKKAEEPTTSVTIKIDTANQMSRSGSPSPQNKREDKEGTPGLLTVEGRSKSPRRQRDGSPSKIRRSTSPVSHLAIERDERSKSVGEDADKKVRRRDPNRTLEKLKETLEPILQGKRDKLERHSQQRDSIGSEEGETVAELPSSRPRPPLLMVTQPSMPSTPSANSTSANIIWSDVQSSDGEWTEGEDEQDYESDLEYSISETFKIPDRLPLGDLYPHSPSRCSPFVSDYDSDTSIPFFAVPSREEDSRGRVDRFMAMPPPTFTCSVHYDGQESWDSEEEKSVGSCSEYEDVEEYQDRKSKNSRPGSSSLGVYHSPAAYSSDEDYDGQKYHGEVQVGCTLKLVDRAAQKGSDEEDSDSEYYDDEEYTDEEYWDESEYEDEDEEYDEDEQEYEDEEEEEYMHSFEESGEDERSPSPVRPVLKIIQPAECDEEEMQFEEMDGNFQVEATFEVAKPTEILPEEGTTNKHREVTYTKDVTMKTEDEITGNLAEDEIGRATAKKITKDGTTGKVEKSMVSQRVIPAEEHVEAVSIDEMPDEEIIELDMKEHEDHTGTKEINVIPTYVRSQTEKVTEESTNRFADKKPSTDFAKKAVIQPTKLETATVAKIETKIAEKPKPAPPVEPAKPAEVPKAEEKKEKKQEVKKEEKEEKKDVKKDVKQGASLMESRDERRTSTISPPIPALQQFAKQMAAKQTVAEEKKPTSIAQTSTTIAPAKEPEDKSGVRKSALNMTAEQAKQKALADEEAAKKKARGLGMVTALMDRFRMPEKKEEPITYKRSSRLTQKDEERPRKKYEIVKPVLNDEFDKQVEELRQKMQKGSSQFQHQLKDLSKGISTVSEEARKREMDEKHKNRRDQATGAFSEAEKEKSRWKEKRDAETEKELTKIEDRGRKKETVAIQPVPVVEEKKAEPKRTVRKINRDKSPSVQPSDTADNKAPVPVAPSFVSEPKPKIVDKVTGPQITPIDANKSIKSSTPVAPTVPPPPPPSAPTTAVPSVPTTKTTAPTNKVAPMIKPGLSTLEKPKLPSNDILVNDDNFDLLQAATAVATRRRKSLTEMKAKKEIARAEGKDVAVITPKIGPKGDGAAATKIRNALGNATNIEQKSPMGSEKGAKRYNVRRKTQEIVNESIQPKVKRRRDRSRKNRFIGNPHDIDVLLGWENEKTFEQMESFFMRFGKDIMPTIINTGKKRRVEAGRIWISDLMDIDKIYKASEIRDILASVNMD